jgi:hypothetical protein
MGFAVFLLVAASVAEVGAGSSAEVASAEAAATSSAEDASAAGGADGSAKALTQSTAEGAAKSSTEGAADILETAASEAESVAKSAANGVLDSFPLEKLALAEIGFADMRFGEGDYIRTIMFLVAVSLQVYYTFFCIQRMMAKRTLFRQTPTNDALAEPLIG